MDEHPMMKPGLGRLTGRVAIVTGADSGIGRAAARLFAREGARVMCNDIWESGEPRIDRLIRDEGGEAEFLTGDVKQPDDWKSLVAATIERFGDLNILVNNAGGGQKGKLHELSDEQWNAIVQTNLYGMYHGVRAVLPHFMATGQGNIVTTASTHGLLAKPENAAYCTSKAAMINLTRQIALDYGPAIRANCVCPGPINTPRYRGWPPQPSFPGGMTPEQEIENAGSVQALKRVGRPEEVAYAMLFLASDESSFITGHALVIDGGQTLDV
jgi:NAD(P)-dependent dehydrogenase (short-subunit alcohol dehydrogenase family)